MSKIIGTLTVPGMIVNDWAISVEEIPGGHCLVARRGSEVQSMDIMDGEPGKDAVPYILPTASESVKGGVKIGEGLYMDGDTIGVVPKSEWEHIETITLTEDATVYRRIEPDGTLYNFKKMYVAFIVEESAVVDGKYVNLLFFRGDSTTFNVCYAAIDSGSGKKVGYVKAEIIDNIANFTGTQSITPNVFANLHYITDRAFKESDVKAFTVLHINTPLPAGTTIKIYGVRT